MSTCPIEMNNCSTNNCKFCEGRFDCILLAILNKLEKMELCKSER
jgi:hypothetical protein